MMKKSCLFLLLITSFHLITACNNEQAKNNETETRTIIGKWDPVAVEGKDLAESDKEEILTGGYMEFSTGGKFTIQSHETMQSRSGLFNYDERTSSLKLISGEEEKNYAIEWISNNKLKLIVPGENLKIIFSKRKALVPSVEDKKDNDDARKN